MPVAVTMAGSDKVWRCCNTHCGALPLWDTSSRDRDPGRAEQRPPGELAGQLSTTGDQEATDKTADSDTRQQPTPFVATRRVTSCSAPPRPRAAGAGGDSSWLTGRAFAKEHSTEAVLLGADSLRHTRAADLTLSERTAAPAGSRAASARASFQVIDR